MNETELKNEITELRNEIHQLHNKIDELIILIQPVGLSNIEGDVYQTSSKSPKKIEIADSTHRIMLDVNKPYITNANRNVYINETGLSSRAYGLLRRANFNVMQDFAYASVEDIRRIKNCGNMTTKEILAYLHARNIILPEAEAIKPAFQIGDTVRLRVDSQWCYSLKAGTELIIRNIVDTNTKHQFKLPLYTCCDKKGQNYFLSPGEIEHIPTT